MNRNEFLKITAIGGFTIGPSIFSNFQDGEKMDASIVQEFVKVGHGNMDKVKSMLEEYPNLINSAHDWNYGDFETCLGAASHVGYKELAQWLIDQGAQANIFTAALFGRMDIIKPMLDFFPKALNAKGPHGFTLLHHAIQGGEDAVDVKKFLESLGAKETKVALY